MKNDKVEEDCKGCERRPYKNLAWFKRRILHAPNQIPILVDSNE